ncbi:MAG: hypothetical protein WA197_24380, partial [Candidatus Acidiferrales bacterium]
MRATPLARVDVQWSRSDWRIVPDHDFDGERIQIRQTGIFNSAPEHFDDVCSKFTRGFRPSVEGDGDSQRETFCRFFLF